MNISNSKYETTGEVRKVSGTSVYRIRSKKNFGDIEAGQLGGWIADENCLNTKDTSWIADEAVVYRSVVRGKARVLGNAKVVDSEIYGSAIAYGTSYVYNSKVYGRAMCGGVSAISYCSVYGNARVHSQANISNSIIRGDTEIGSATVRDSNIIRGTLHTGRFIEAKIVGYASSMVIHPIGSENGTLTVYKGTDGQLHVTRGCFHGTFEDFAEAVEATHGKTRHGVIYRSAIELIKLNFKFNVETV